MGRRSLVFVVVLAVTVSGCFTRRIAERMGRSGWTSLDCPSDESKPIVVLVHGIGGEGPETTRSLEELRGWPVVRFKWVPFDDRDEVAQRLGAGVSRLSACSPERGVIVIAHSAGGVVASHAARWIRASGPVDVWTVASPLAGTVRRAANADGSAEAVLMLDLGTRILRYPAAAPGVSVKHLRTAAPADHIMTPVGDLLPNDPKVGVPGAPQLDLPPGLDHSGALVWVVEQLVEGHAEAWRSSAAVALSPGMPAR